jgi:hypothetical protein
MYHPRQIKLGGHIWKISWKRNDLGGAAGVCAPAKHQIAVDTMQDDETAMSDGSVFHTFLHEVMHAIDVTYCDCRVFKGAKHGDESEWMNSFVEGLLQFLLDNWTALEKMKKSLDKR